LYIDWTGDEEFAHGPGLSLLVETARYWRSRIRMGRDRTAHIYGVIGPDEYHETVDDNAFTNVMARWNMRRAADAVEATTLAHDVPVDEIARWRELADAIVDGYDPATGIYEQFDGFNRLEPMLIEEVSPRRPIAADLLLGAARVRSAQVLKQADVLMLYHQVPDELVPGTLEANLRFYEPRTAHGSSLSPAIHAALFARVGDHDRALDALEIAARMDLDDLTGTTSSGLHLATMGGLWQAIAFGFAGLRPAGDRLVIDPRHPPALAALEVRVRFRGSRLRVRTERSRLTIHAEPNAAVVVGGTSYTVDANGMRFSWCEPNWEVAR
jgi:trehalose/maltose hydrolase-like predicted phosphorylase